VLSYPYFVAFRFFSGLSTAFRIPQFNDLSLRLRVTRLATQLGRKVRALSSNLHISRHQRMQFHDSRILSTYCVFSGTQHANKRHNWKRWLIRSCRPMLCGVGCCMLDVGDGVYWCRLYNNHHTSNSWCTTLLILVIQSVRASSEVTLGPWRSCQLLESALVQVVLLTCPSHLADSKSKSKLLYDWQSVSK
jgi:hypothetical protein